MTVERGTTERAPVLIVQPYDVYLLWARGLGVPVVALYGAEAEQTTLRRHTSEVVTTFVADLEDPAALDEVLQRVRAEFGQIRVVQFGDERTMESVARAAERIGFVVESPDAIRRLNNKEAFLETASAIGAITRAWCSASRLDGLAQVEATGGPWILKPADGSGSTGLIYAERWSEVVPHLGGTGWVLEQYVDGAEFSVETLSVDGVHHAFGVTAKTTSGPPHFVERAHVFPADRDDALEATLTSAVFGFLDAAGYRHGPAHTEVIVHAHGIDLVESQARIGGDRIPTLVARATGVDPEAELMRSLDGVWAPPERSRHGRARIDYVDLPYGLLETPIEWEDVGASDRSFELQQVAHAGGRLAQPQRSRERHAGIITSSDEADLSAPSTAPLRATVRVRESTPTLVLFGATDEQVEQCVRLGHVLVLVQAHDQLTPYQQEAAAVVVMCDLGSRANVDWVARHLAPYVQLPFVSVRQYGTLLRALVCDRLGVASPAPSLCSETTIDKARLRERIHQLRLPAPQWRTVRAAQEAVAFCEEHGGRGVLKVTQGTGGVGVHRLATGASTDLQVVQRRVAELLPRGVSTAGFLVEEQIDGPLISLESLWVQGVHLLLGVTTTTVSASSTAELHHTFPGRVEDDVVRAAAGQVERLFGSLGMHAGGTHVEFIVADGTPIMIDAHDRPGGGHIPELVENALGRSSTYLAVAAQTGQLTVEDAAALRVEAVSSIRFVTTPEDVLIDDRDAVERALKEAGDMTGVRRVCLEGDGMFLPAEVDNWTRPGHVITVGQTAEIAEARADAAHARVIEGLGLGVTSQVHDVHEGSRR